MLTTFGGLKAPPPRSELTLAVLPQWAAEPFLDFLDYQEKLQEILHISMRGIRVLTAMPNLIEAVRDSARTPDERGEYEGERLERARKEAALAQEEVELGFPLLQAQAAISLWGSLEALVRTFLARWLVNSPGAMQAAEITKLRVRVGEYESLTPEERAFYVLDLLEEVLNCRRSPGTGRFEALLKVFSLTSDVGDDIRRDLFELSQVRHVLVHRRGTADRRFIVACPWLNVEVGTRIVVRHSDVQRYGSAAAEYALELVQRIRLSFGLDRYSPEPLSSGGA